MTDLDGEKKLLIGGIDHLRMNLRMLIKKMNDMMDEWREVRRMKRLNQELYDLLGGAIIFILGYSRKNNIPIPQYSHLKRMSDRIHSLINEINTSTDESLHSDKDRENRRRLDRTKKQHTYVSAVATIALDDT
jgi:hypothetical protein